MNSFIDRIKQNRLWDFPGGVYPAQYKELSNQYEIADVSLPPEFYIPVKQHIGVEGQLSIAVGDKVLKGQTLTQSSHPFAVPIHAPTSGEISAIQEHVSAHPSGVPGTTIVLKPDGLEKWIDLEPLQDYKSLPRADIVERLCQSGITGLGGAGFPTHIKLSSDKSVQCLIINGVECEPYITSDDRLMREHAWQIRQGIDVLVHLLAPEHVIVAIEDNKPDAIQAMQVACQDEDKYLICAIPTKYPAGGEKQLIEILTGQQVPKGKLPIDMGILMQNVGTCFAVADAVFTGKPLIQRVITLTGKALKAPKNVWGLLGTPVEHLLQEAEYNSKKQKRSRIIMGGPMMGFTVASVDVPVVKITNCLLVPADKELPLPEQEIPCIRCGACADACPAGLLPQQLYWHSKAKELEKAQEFNIADCIECGACAFVCPSNIPLVHYYRQTKADIRIAEEQKQKSDKSKARFNSRQDRLEREKLEREEKRKQSALAREKAKASAKVKADDASTEMTDSANGNSDKSSKVAAAIARAKAKKAAGQKAESNTDQKADQNASQSTDASPETPEESKTAETSNKDRVAAAIARAKAKKAAAQEVKQQAEPASEPELTQSSDAEEPASNKDKVAAAIARAKARKLQKEQEQQAESAPPNAATTQESTTTKPSEESHKESHTDSHKESHEEIRRKRVEAAIAKAKARQKERNKNNISDSGEQ